MTISQKLHGPKINFVQIITMKTKIRTNYREKNLNNRTNYMDGNLSNGYIKNYSLRPLL
jgi:hypothetical protein